jgi:hypothetical protein
MNSRIQTKQREAKARSVVKGAQYRENFQVSGKVLVDEAGTSQYKPHQVKINNYFRLNGNTPGKNAIVYLIETSDGRKGTLVYRYDAFTDSRVFNFLQDLVDIQMERCKATREE